VGETNARATYIRSQSPMPPRSKVITMLPVYIRQEVERRLFENGFRDYEGLAQWVRGQGYEISDDSLWRFGHALQQQLAAVRFTVGLARAVNELAEGQEPLLARALITVAQQQALAALVEKEDVKAGDLNAIANLTRAAIAQQRWAAEQKTQGERQHQAAADRNCRLPDETQPSRNALSTIAGLEQGPAGALTASQEPVGRSDPPGETSRGDERRPPVEHRAPETGIALEGSSIASSDVACAASIQPVLHLAAPRIAAGLCVSKRPLQNKERFANKEPVPASLARSCPRSLDFVRDAHFVRDDILGLSSRFGSDAKVSSVAKVSSKERAVGDASGLLGTPSPGGQRAPTQRDADP
jgi:hypothetical protein